MRRGVTDILRGWFGDFAYSFGRALQARRHELSLKPIQDNTDRIEKDDILLFCTLRNEAVRIPAFLDYYQRLGVKHFLFVDNGSDDHFMDLVREREDVSVWFTTASYRASNFGMHWLNALLRRYGTGHWCVTCDPDEFLVFPYCDSRNLQDLAGYLDGEERESLCCLMLDMYGEHSVEETRYREGDNPFELAPCFDPSGYSQKTHWLEENYTRGGVRRRVFFHDQPDRAPALNKTPFVKWKRGYQYFLSMHQLVPMKLNRPHGAGALSPTGCVMHFKYFSLFQDKAEEEMERGEHWNNSLEYRRYDQHLGDDGKLVLSCDLTQRYEGWESLEKHGLLSRGEWF